MASILSGAWCGMAVVCCCPARPSGVVWSAPRLARCVVVSAAVMSCYCLVAVSCGVVWGECLCVVFVWWGIL